jgi:hypothetical protein
MRADILSAPRAVLAKPHSRLKITLELTCAEKVFILSSDEL